MRDHELELIAALAEGRLEDESEARALIASSPEHLAEYEAQKLAFETLRSTPPAAMTDIERAALHRDVWTELRSPVPVGASGNPWYYRWMPVAAGMFVVVGLVAVINQGGQDELAPAELMVTTSAGEGLAGEEAGTVSTAAEAGADGEDAGSGSTPTVTDSRALDAPEVAYYEAEADKVREGELEGVEVEGLDEETPQAVLESCLEEAGLSEYEIVAASTAPFPEEVPDTTIATEGSGEGSTSPSTEDTLVPAGDTTQYLAAVPAGATLADAPVAFVDLYNCVLIHLDD